MKIPNSPCESCSRGKRCTSKSDTCKRFWVWFKSAWAEVTGPLRAIKLKKAGYRCCMRTNCQWANADGLCVTPCMEPEKRDYAADMVQHNQDVCKAYHKRMRRQKGIQNDRRGEKRVSQTIPSDTGES